MRIAAGETIALLFELARDMDSVSSKPCCVLYPDFCHSCSAVQPATGTEILLDAKGTVIFVFFVVVGNGMLT